MKFEFKYINHLNALRLLVRVAAKFEIIIQKCPIHNIPKICSKHAQNTANLISKLQNKKTPNNLLK